MKNIRGALFVLSLSIVLLFNSTSIAQSKEPTIWVCGSGGANYEIIKFKSFEFLKKNLNSKYSTPFAGKKEDLKKIEAKILKERNCHTKIEKQSYTRLYKKISSSGQFRDNKIPITWEWYSLTYKEKTINRDTFLKLSKKYNEYPLKNLASTTQTQKVAKKKGCIKGNCYNGNGTYLYSSGSKYVGEFKDGKLHGQGTVTFIDISGSRVTSYAGGWKDGKYHGQGTLTLTGSGSKYVGEFKDGKRHGQGTLTYADGTIDNGIWKNGKLVKRNKIQTQIAKKEPSQTQQVAKKKENIKANQNLIDKYFGDNPTILTYVFIVLLFSTISTIGIFILKSKSKQKTKPFARAATSGAINQYAWKGKKILKYKNWGVIVPAIVLSIWFGEKYYNANPDKAIQQAKQVAQAAKKTGQDWKCKLFDVCQSEEKTQQVAKKIINIYCVKNNYSAIRMEKGEKPNCKNGEFKVVKNEYLLLETVYDNLASYFDLNDPNEVVLFDRRVRDIFKITHQDFNKLTKTKQVAIIKSTKKSFNIFKKEEKKITTKEVLDLGKYTEFNAYPEGMLKEFKNCKKQACRGKISGKKVYEIFARRGELWHQRHPGDIIHGMAWFEIFYLEKLRKNEKQIARYIKNGSEGYSSKTKMRKDVSSLHGLIKTNKGRIKMREALGLSLNDNLETVLKRHWLLGDFLNKDKLKVKKVAIGSDIKKRKKLLAEYKSALTRYKNKLEEERRATN